ncbi:hypothetical protein A9Q81_24810 [Gammaproteobacteria bacterium 42_54_T18]|nr:hypothetical protein A9Q81_24810 [Gammaproteobacteria bacterium 42_54_T18]
MKGKVMDLHISQLYRYPVKSMGAVALPHAQIDRFGIEKDRRWMLIDNNGKFLTQRNIAKMTLLSVTEHQSDEGGWGLTIQTAQNTVLPEQCEPTLSFVVSKHFAMNESISVEVWSEICEGKVANDFINQWLSVVLDVPCRLVFMEEAYYRNVDKEYAKNNETVSFADGFPLLLTTEPSLAAFNQHLESPIEMLRFRPNMVISENYAFAEDSWKRLRVGNVDFCVAKPCSRCVIPTINRLSAKKEPAVFKALKQYRSIGKEVFFGQNLLAMNTGVISVGDKVEIIE